MAPETWQLEAVPCDYCGSTEADILRRGRDRMHGLPGDFNVVACRQCGLARTSPRPTPASLAAAYPSDYGPHQAGHAARAPEGLLRWALVNRQGYPLGRPASGLVRAIMAPLAAHILARHLERGYLPWQGEGRLLDFGCGAGGYVARMAAAGWKAEGLDMGAEAVRTARAAGLTVHEGTLPGAALPPESYDAVTLWHSLEHVPSPKATLAAVARLLRPGGLVLVVVPRFDSLESRWFGPCWWGLDVPRHLTHFTAATLRRHLESAGLSVEGEYGPRHPSWIRHSFALRAADTGRALHRRLERSRIAVGLLSRWESLLGRAGQVMVVARRGAR
jgi:SAM-dependent methyltransferase